MDAKSASPEQIRQRAVEGIITTAIAQGTLDLNGLNDDQADEAIQAFIVDFVTDASPIRGNVDHRPKLLDAGNQFKENDDYQLAALSYSTWAEHWLNFAIACFGRKQNLSDDRITHIIRDVPLRGKLTWLLPLLGGTEIEEWHRVAITHLSNHRNCFVHYKWKYDEVDAMELTPQQLIKSVDDFQATIEYLIAYEDQHIFCNARSHARRFSRRQPE